MEEFFFCISFVSPTIVNRSIEWNSSKKSFFPNVSESSLTTKFVIPFPFLSNNLSKLKWYLPLLQLFFVFFWRITTYYIYRQLDPVLSLQFIAIGRAIVQRRLRIITKIRILKNKMNNTDSVDFFIFLIIIYLYFLAPF